MKELSTGPAAGGGVTLPVKPTLRAPEAPECTTVRLAELAPNTVGVKLTVRVQPPPTASVVPTQPLALNAAP